MLCKRELLNYRHVASVAVVVLTQIESCALHNRNVEHEYIAAS